MGINGDPKFQQRGFHKYQGGQCQQREETEPGSAQVQGKMGENVKRGDGRKRTGRAVVTATMYPWRVLNRINSSKLRDRKVRKEFFSARHRKMLLQLFGTAGVCIYSVLKMAEIILSWSAHFHYTQTLDWATPMQMGVAFSSIYKTSL